MAGAVEFVTSALTPKEDILIPFDTKRLVLNLFQEIRAEHERERII